MAEPRTKFTDPDFRHNPKTKHFCALCQRDLKPGQPYRLIMVEEDAWSAAWSAARSAARSAAWSALLNTTKELQQSALALAERMIAAKDEG